MAVSVCLGQQEGVQALPGVQLTSPCSSRTGSLGGQQMQGHGLCLRFRVSKAPGAVSGEAMSCPCGCKSLLVSGLAFPSPYSHAGLANPFRVHKLVFACPGIHASSKKSQLVDMPLCAAPHQLEYVCVATCTKEKGRAGGAGYPSSENLLGQGWPGGGCAQAGRHSALAELLTAPGCTTSSQQPVRILEICFEA